VQQQTLPAINKLGDAGTSELIAGAYSVVHVWKTLLNAIRAKASAKPGSTRGGHGGRKAATFRFRGEADVDGANRDANDPQETFALLTQKIP
jgi:hypothetical protein